MLDAFKKFLGLTGRLNTVILEGGSKNRGSVAISYLTWPFLEDIHSGKGRGHTNAYEVKVMAEAFVELGFRVEISDWDDATYIPPSDCRVAIDLHSNLERWSRLLPPQCKRVLHATGCHWKVLNAAETKRLEALKERKGKRLDQRRQVKPTNAVKYADEIVVLGNEYTMESYRFAAKLITRVPISSAYEYQNIPEKDYQDARKRFLWIGSYGMVHKGLDLVIEAFAGMPDLELTICGRPEKEDDFFRLYEREMKNTSNIHLHGWIDMSSSEFMEISRTHAAVVYPSSSEGGAGSVIHCMHAGMVPICTREASVDLMDFGIQITDSSVAAVQDACRAFSSLEPAEIQIKSEKTLGHVREHHTREHFKKNYKCFAERITRGL